MSELHIKDTTRVLEEAEETFAQVLPELVNDYSEKWGSVCTEARVDLDDIKYYREVIKPDYIRIRGSLDENKKS